MVLEVIWWVSNQLVELWFGVAKRFTIIKLKVLFPYILKTGISILGFLITNNKESKKICIKGRNILINNFMLCLSLKN